jgi:MFS family permease
VVAILAAGFLFNLGQGALRPSLPLFLRHAFEANYRMVNLIPVVFGAGKSTANLPTGYLLGRVGGARLMVIGLVLIAACDLVSARLADYWTFLGVRGVAGAGWAMFATVATSAMIRAPAMEGRGRAVSLLLTVETLGLLIGTAGGGWLYERAGVASPFVFEAACMLAAAAVVSRLSMPPARGRPAVAGITERRRLADTLRLPGVLHMCVVNAALVAIQTGALVFLLPLYLLERGGVRPDAVGYLSSLVILGRLLTLWLGGTLSDRWGRRRVLVPGLLALGGLLVTLGFVTHPVLLGLWTFAIGAGAGAVASLPTAIVGDLVPPAQQGIAIGWLRTVSDAGMLIGPLALGALADAVHLSAPFVGAGMLAGGLAASCRRSSVPPT